ncbi:hypothetical protein KL936_001342 [Ogataea polymorpha]|nr:hypothetical protein KL936_001342 [Ogataea polymorpha]
MIARWIMPAARTAFRQRRFVSTPKEVFTELSDEQDPKRASIFEYSWGSWLENDIVEKEKRRTQFSIKGLNDLLAQVVKPFQGSVLLPVAHNVSVLKDNVDLVKTGFSHIKQISSIHEGKHHRIYKLQLDHQEDELVLRVPYKLDSEVYTDRRIKSEAATMDFLDKKLGLNVPRVLAYSSVAENPVGIPFMLMEFKKGELLMRNWNPLTPGPVNDEKSKTQLMSVISPIAEFNKRVTDFTFTHYGSLYFKEDGFEHIVDEPYVGETQESLKNRWVIGPTVEKAYYRNKDVEVAVIDKFVGPWTVEQPLKMVADLAQLELKNLQKQGHDQAIPVYKKLAQVAEKLFDVESKTIPHMDALLAPRLALPDLDPMNVIIGDETWFIDFEGACIKPFLLTSYPKFVQYSGPKIFDLEADVEDFDKLDDVAKQQYEYMFYRTRNQFYWELALNETNKELLGVISPAVKLIKNAYLSALDAKTEKDYLYVENGLVELYTMWPHYESAAIVKGPNPLSFSEQELQAYETAFRDYQTELSSMPFAATGGWVPQDMFARLLEQKLLVEKNGSYTFDRDKLLQ